MKENIIKALAYTAEQLGLVENIACEQAVALAVRVHRQNSRQGTLGCKDRSALISRSNRKPWKQKGTGRARAGTARSPLWCGGAVSHGPQPRVRKLSLPRQISHLALLDVMAKRAQKNQIIGLNFAVGDEVIKTAQIAKAIKESGLKGKLTILCDWHDVYLCQALANIPYVTLVSYDAVHPYALMQGSYIVFFEKDKELFNKMVSAWSN